MKNKFKDNSQLIQLLQQVDKLLTLSPFADRQCNFMEICGTHTVSILKYGFRNYFKKRINFLSGPGCPVCVTSQKDIDKVISLAQMGVRIATFGDLIKVPGSKSSLEEQMALGKEVNVVYNPLDCLKIADETDEEVVFIAVGFETTIPVIASLILDAKKLRIENLSILPLMKTIPTALNFLLTNLENEIDGFICPGHVSVIIGERPYKIIPEKYGIPCVIAGFEPVDIGLAIESLVSQIRKHTPIVDNRYKRVVKEKGNISARRLIEEVFEKTDVEWRGFGEVPASGLKLREKFSKFDAEKKFNINVKSSPEPEGCICGEVIAGKKQPVECPLFAKKCTPDTPIGPCMVSYEGACSAFYKYGEE
ncbi:MAG: hydrogenase formation protein HypD [Candidatus Cloacimonadota bacterium]|nr:hydrogenase formation protein HypD [Candidatus Cloacimonadota bacterium]